jgi:hypothetical protein
MERDPARTGPTGLPFARPIASQSIRMFSRLRGPAVLSLLVGACESPASPASSFSTAFELVSVEGRALPTALRQDLPSFRILLSSIEIPLPRAREAWGSTPATTHLETPDGRLFIQEGDRTYHRIGNLYSLDVCLPRTNCPEGRSLLWSGWGILEGDSLVFGGSEGRPRLVYQRR